jgi:hypothetical protein
MITLLKLTRIRTNENCELMFNNNEMGKEDPNFIFQNQNEYTIKEKKKTTYKALKVLLDQFLSFDDPIFPSLCKNLKISLLY